MQTVNGNDLRRQRLRLGWSRDQFAHYVGVTAETVALWEEGTQKIDCPAVVGQILRQSDDDRTDDHRNAPRW